MSISINLSASGLSIGKPTKNERTNKGKSLIAFPDTYAVIDIETTGLDPNYDEIIEIAAVKVKEGAIIDTFQTLVKPQDSEIDDFIEDLTGITSEMLIDAPSFNDICSDFLTFIGDNILIGHNVNFDINFLYDASGGKLTNSFVDTMRISRRILTALKHHRLKDIANYYKISTDGSHRSLADCQITNACYNALCSEIVNTFGSLDEYTKSIAKKNYGANANDISSNKETFDETHLLYGKNCVFTGTLERMQRKDAMQLVADLGGVCQNSVTTKTNFLILGNNDYCSNIKDGKSNKQKKADALKLAGNDIEVITENVFYDIVFD